MAKMKMEVLATPVGELVWMYLDGQGALNYNEDGYQYKGTVLFDENDPNLLKYTAKIDAFWEKHKHTVSGDVAKTKGYKPQIGKDKKPTGKVEITYATKTEFEDKKTGEMKPVNIRIFDAGAPGVKPEQISLNGKKIGNGSKGAISGNMAIYKAGRNLGVALYLNAVQVVDLIEFGGETGFESSEDDEGYRGETDTGGFAGEQPEANLRGDTTEPNADSEPNQQARPEL